jgi:hypothetical protein
MSNPEMTPEQRKMVLTSQIILAALVTGCLFFLLIVLLIVPGKLGGWELGLDKQPMTVVALVTAFGILAVRIIVPRVITAQMLRLLFQRESNEPGWGDVFRVYQTTLIIKAAMLEGAVFLLLVMHMIERSPWTLALAVVFVVSLLLHMPTPQQVDGWIERQSLAGKEQLSMR